MLRPSRRVDGLIPPTHGGIDYAELKRHNISPEQVIDFSVSVNPLGPPPGIETAISKASIERYPDSESTGLRQAIAEDLSLSPEQVMVGSGSTEIIRLIACAFFNPGDLVVIPQPTYGEYETACHLAGARTLKPWVLGEPGLRFDIPGLQRLIAEHRPRGLFICNPNNPTGEYLSQEVVNGVLKSSPGCLLVLDEAYVAFTGDAWSSTGLLATGRVIIVRSMTKDFALPGLRLGFALASKDAISVLNRVKPPWNVSAVAQAAGQFVLGSSGYLKECAARLRGYSEFLVNGLRARGFDPVPSQANFFLVRVGDAAGYRKALLSKGIIVRDCTSFGLPAYLRLAARTIEECEKLLTALDDPEVRKNGG